MRETLELLSQGGGAVMKGGGSPSLEPPSCHLDEIPGDRAWSEMFRKGG